MNKRERLEAVIQGQSVDGVPVAFWRHFPGDDQDPASLATATIAFQQRWDFDFVKVTPASSFQLKDWGVQDIWLGNTEGTREYNYHPIQRASDWRALKVLEPRSGALGAQLKCLKLVVEALPDVPVIQTVFSPLAQMKNLAGDRLLIDLRQNTADFKTALETITQSTLAFVREIAATGAAGIFYAVQHATANLLSEAEFKEFGRAYDLRILETTRNYWLNVMHLHGDHVYFEAVADYPLQVWNWHDRETGPSLKEGLTRIKGAACGGIARDMVMLRGQPEAVRQQVEDAIAQTNGRRYIIGTGCVTMIPTPEVNMRTAIECARLPQR
ncbi:MAG TPA: uroporphyrinogen decarboxylase family protein [Anaerolineae bacterium]|nr:uroporphyrinogen decarboxylase family protein [Anaerolineae bacterium]